MYVGRSNNPLKSLERSLKKVKEWRTQLLDDAGRFKYKVGLDDFIRKYNHELINVMYC